MGSLSFGEIFTILVIVLIIFGPKRLPEFARKIGELIAWARKSLRDFTETIEGELGEGTQPLADLKREFDGARNDLTGAINTLGGSGSSQPLDRTDSADEPDDKSEASANDSRPQPSEAEPTGDRSSAEDSDDPVDSSPAPEEQTGDDSAGRDAT